MSDNVTMHENAIMPEQLKGLSAPDVLLGYQKNLMANTAIHRVVLCSKSRRIGMTWGAGSDAVLHAATEKASGGMDVFYIGYNLEMAREFISVCAMWAKNFSHIASDVEEWVFEEEDEKGEKNAIKAFRITFDSGYEIIALSSKPRSLRGRQGYIIIDEAAFHDDLEELLKAAMAMLIWGGKVLVISTHDGVDNPFNQLIQDAHAGRNKYKVVEVDFDQALQDGLYERICLVTGKEYSKEAEDQWRQEIVDFYGEGADEELFCVPKKSSGAFLSSTLVESCMVDSPVIRLEKDEAFGMKPLHKRESEIQDWCEEHLKPLLNQLNPKFKTSFGEDFGRSGDLTCIHILQTLQDLTRHTPFTVELRNIPFAQQRQIIWYIIDRLPRFSGAAFDARGNGQQIAEETADRYGSNLIHEIMATDKYYLEAFTKYKAGLEDRKITLPNDADILADHRVAQRINNVPKIPKQKNQGKDGKKRHGDALIAAVNAYWASFEEAAEYAYRSTSTINQTTNHNNFMRPKHNDHRSLSSRSRRFDKGVF